VQTPGFEPCEVLSQRPGLETIGLKALAVTGLGALTDPKSRREQNPDCAAFPARLPKKKECDCERKRNMTPSCSILGMDQRFVAWGTRLRFPRNKLMGELGQARERRRHQQFCSAYSTIHLPAPATKMGNRQKLSVGQAFAAPQLHRKIQSI